MSAEAFVYPPSPRTLHWLGAGQLASRFQRTVRLWVLLQRFYGPSPNWAEALPETFSYPKLRDRIYAPSHGQGDYLSAEHLTASCSDESCVCHQPLSSWVLGPDSGQTEIEWCQEMGRLAGISQDELAQHLDSHPFATVHRSIRDDLRLLAQLGWLNPVGRGRYQCLPAKEWPRPGATLSPAPSFAHLSLEQTWELLQVLESVALVQPHLGPIVQSLWEQVASVYPGQQSPDATQQRIFIHGDYYRAPALRERIEAYQEQLKQLWRRVPGNPIQFAYWLAPGEQIEVVTYPVCLQYDPQARYLSSYGQRPDPEAMVEGTGTLSPEVGWYNYRLDRIASEKLAVLDWDDERIPAAVKKQRQADKLPVPETVRSQLDTAWGLDFYQPRQLAILRATMPVALWQIDERLHYPSFKPIAYERLPTLLKKHVKASQDRQQILGILQRCSPDDAYYQVWVRQGDETVLRRLRELRSQVEVIAPLSLRQRLTQEAGQELLGYVLDAQQSFGLAW